ncbi:glycosyltransferase [Floccifex sp.]|uniref:glycosyltransferase n=1 Tax=Floccifex sp. TaxID=2815810 RepID=UPI003EFBCC9B
MANLTQKAISVLKTDGINGVIKHAKRYVKVKQESKKNFGCAKDILFVNGCDPQLLPHPSRYRVTHQREQCELCGYKTDEVFYKSIQFDMVYKYRAFVFFRCVLTDEIEQFIKIAKQLNKTVFFDVDDLVIDTKYTDKIEYVQSMDNKQQYDNDVKRMGQCLAMCDVAITTTKALQNELLQYVDTVIINRNCASIEMVNASQKVKKDVHDTIRIGYFSGSITHNADFEMIYPVLEEILEQYSNVELHVCGELDTKGKTNIVTHPFMDYKKLPELIGQMDINIAPLCESIFNEAKSENKWIEASLVKTCTVASDLGAFKECIENGKTGLLCKTLNDWKNNLLACIESKNLRDTLANNAYEYCLRNCTTMYRAGHLVHQLEQYIHPNICFVVSKLEISGGIMVALHHMEILQDNGYDVSILSLYDTIQSYEFENHIFPVLGHDTDFHIDQAIATMWATCSMMDEIKNIKVKKYLVQNFETDFYNFSDSLKVQAQQSYSPKTDVRFLTISKWCQDWLKEEFYKDAKYAYNGIDSNRFNFVSRNWNGKIRILIEGDCSAPHKNVDESFKITNCLDFDKFEIWYMSYNAKPKDWYHVDRFMHRIPYDEVPSVYQQCHILLKTSLLESFSYPPLEMMATGGCVVALANDGNIEYLVNQENCLFYEKGNIQQALDMIQSLCQNESLRTHLIEHGLECAKNRDWNHIQKDIVALYKD